MPDSGNRIPERGYYAHAFDWLSLGCTSKTEGLSVDPTPLDITPRKEDPTMDASLGPILVVEDDQDHALLIRSVFKHRSLGEVVRVVSTGQDALAYLEAVPPYDDRARYPLPKVIILDLNLPITSGFEVPSWLSVSEEHSDIPVIVFTSSTDPEDARMAYSLGARSYKSKPDFFDLVDLVRDVVGE